MKLIHNNFYYIFLLLSLICAAIVFIHDVAENIMNDLSLEFIYWQIKTRALFWVLYIIQQMMFCYWLMTMYNVLSSLRINKRYSGALAWTVFVPILNLYFPQTMVQELFDRLYYLKVPHINIRFVPIWWFFQCIAYLYMTGSALGLLSVFESPNLFWVIIVIELCWAVAIACQGYLLYGFMKAITHVGSSRRNYANEGTARDSASSRRRRNRY